MTAPRDCECCAGVQVETPVVAANPPGLSQIAYRTGTHGQFLASMLARLSSPAYPALAGLTARSVGDPAIALLDDWAVVADLLTFHAERIANEGYLRTATQAQSLRLLGRLVGHRMRPGVAAGTYLAYTLDRDPAAGPDTAVTIPKGSRAQSVPGAGEDPQSFEISADLPARWSWNDLQVRLRRTYQLDLDRLGSGGQVHLAGTANDVKVGDRLLFVFGTERGRQSLLVVPSVRIDQRNGVTAVDLPGAEPPDFRGLAATLRKIAGDAVQAPIHGTSRIVQRYVDGVLQPIVDEVPPAEGGPGTGSIGTPTQFGLALDGALEQLAETIELSRQYDSVQRFLAGLQSQLADLRAAVALLEPPQPEPQQQTLHAALRLDEAGAGAPAVTPATLGLGAVLGALRVPPARPPAGSGDLPRDPQQLFEPGSDLGVRLLTALDARIRDGLYPAWQRLDVTAPLELQQLQAMRTVATPFGATAPMRSTFDAQGRLTGQVDWPLVGTQSLDVRIDFSNDQDTPERASFTWTESGLTSLAQAGLDADRSVDVGPGTVDITIQREEPPGPQAAAGQGAVTGVTFTLRANLPDRTITVSTRDAGGLVEVTVTDGQTIDNRLGYGDFREADQGALQVRMWRVAPVSGQSAAYVEVSLQTSLALTSRNVLALDAQYEGIGPGSWVVIQRPGKASVQGGVDLREVITQVRGVRVVSRADFGITGKVTELTLATDWLDQRDTMLSQIRDATVYTRGDALTLATEPVTDDVAGGEIELAQLYLGLDPGRWIVVTGERTDIPDTAGVMGTELTMIGAVRQTVDPARPGDAVHTTITLAAPLSYRYRRDTMHVLANVEAATQGASRDEPIGSGDASRRNQTFTLFGHPLTWLAADTPLGAASTLEVRVDGVRWTEVDSLAGRGPAERVYVTAADEQGTVSVTFGDGVNGARLPTGAQNVRATYRVGIGPAGNVPAGRITQLLTRPLWVSGVTNPVPATGGAGPDDADQARRNIPLSITALDRLVSVPDYEDFARTRAGIGRASARRLSDGSRQVVHVTVAGVDDIPLTDTSGIVTTLAAALSELGDPQLPVAVAVRELVMLVLSANVRVDAEHTWRLVEPRVRAALLDRLGFARRELGQPAYLSEAIVAAQSVPGVDYVDVDVFAGVPGSLTPAGLDTLRDALTSPQTVVPARLAVFEEQRAAVTPPAGQRDATLTHVAAENGITVAELLRLNPDITTTTLPAGRSVVVFRGIRPAQLAVLSPTVPDTLILKEIRS